MKIAIISYEYPPDTALGGIATYAYQAARMLAAKGHQVEVFVASPKSNSTNTEDGVVVHKVLADSRIGFKNAVAKRFYDRHQLIGFDILEGPDFGADASQCIALVPDIPLTVKLHSPYFIIRKLSKNKTRVIPLLRGIAGSLIRMRNPFTPKYNRYVDPEFLHILDADVIAAPSLAMAEKIKKEWKLENRIFDLVPLPYIPSTEYLEIDPNTRTKTVLYFGRLELSKGVLDLAKAIPHILQKFPTAKFKFIGRSLPSPVPGIGMREYLCRLLKPYLNSIEFEDQVEPSQIPKKLAQVDICVFPSLWESYGFVCLEAMAAARGVVATNAGGMQEILDNGKVGILVPPKQPLKIAKAINDLLDNDAYRIQLGIAARERVLSHYNAEVIYNLHINSYQRTIAEKKRKANL